MEESTFVHKSVLLYDTVGSLNIKPGGLYVDGTLGGGGHAYEVCKRLGSGKLIVITVISALLSGYVQQKFSGPWFGGLSGVVYALMGYVWLRGERDPQSGIFLQRGLIIFALIWIVAGWFDVFGMSMANGAHIAGLAVGLAMAFADTMNVRKRT